MNTRIQYRDDIERQSIIAANTDKILIEEQNIIGGNFLVFSDTQPEIEKVIVTEQVKDESLYEAKLNSLSDTVAVILNTLSAMNDQIQSLLQQKQ
jgi:hypothetical protein